MIEPASTSRKKLEELQKERDTALIAVQQTKYFFEESVKQTERFWAQFRWISGVLVTVIVVAVGYQAYQSHIRLSDAIKNANDSMNTYIDSADKRVQQMEIKADQNVKAAIEKLYSAEVKSAIVKNSTDESKRLIGYTEFEVQTGNNVPYGIDLTISIRFRIGYEGTGTTNIGGFNVSADEELLESIFENDVGMDRDAFAGGTFMRAADFAALPGQLYPFSLQIQRRILNCEDYDALMQKFKASEKLGTLTISPVFRDLPDAPKFDFDVQIGQRKSSPCQALWNLGREQAEKN